MAKKMRCTFCNKKTGLIYFTCKCEGKFCKRHLYAHEHNCPCLQEKKEDTIKILKENNPKVEVKKMIVI
jgi:predicted nucleic acid binding AN1-type Zn finger protein